MANTPVTPPRVDFFDPRTGKISREWFMYFIALTRNVDGVPLTLGELNDVNVPSPVNNQVLEWDSATNKYVMTSDPVFGTVTATTVTATTVNTGSIASDTSTLGDATADTTNAGVLTASQATIGDVTGGNYFEVETTGFTEAHGDARNWDDVYPSAASVSSTGPTIPVISAYSGSYLAPEFVGTGVVVDSMTLHFQIYHSYDEVTPVVPHLHLYIPDLLAGGTIKFYADIAWSNTGDTGAESTSTVSGTVVRGASAGIAKNQILSFGDIVGTGKTISSILTMRIYRDPADAGDTFAASVWLKSADVHIRKNTGGSRNELTK